MTMQQGKCRIMTHVCTVVSVDPLKNGLASLGHVYAHVIVALGCFRCFESRRFRYEYTIYQFIKYKEWRLISIINNRVQYYTCSRSGIKAALYEAPKKEKKEFLFCQLARNPFVAIFQPYYLLFERILTLLGISSRIIYQGFRLCPASCETDQKFICYILLI